MVLTFESCLCFRDSCTLFFIMSWHFSVSLLSRVAHEVGRGAGLWKRRHPGWHPFYVPRVDDEQSVKRKIVSEDPVEFAQDVWTFVSAEAQDLCRALLEKFPDRRPSAEQVAGKERLSKSLSSSTRIFRFFL